MRVSYELDMNTILLKPDTMEEIDFLTLFLKGKISVFEDGFGLVIKKE